MGNITKIKVEKKSVLRFSAMGDDANADVVVGNKEMEIVIRKDYNGKVEHYYRQKSSKRPIPLTEWTDLGIELDAKAIVKLFTDKLPEIKLARKFEAEKQRKKDFKESVWHNIKRELKVEGLETELSCTEEEYAIKKRFLYLVYKVEHKDNDLQINLQADYDGRLTFYYKGKTRRFKVRKSFVKAVKESVQSWKDNIDYDAEQVKEKNDKVKQLTKRLGRQVTKQSRYHPSNRRSGGYFTNHFGCVSEKLKDSYSEKGIEFTYNTASKKIEVVFVKGKFNVDTFKKLLEVVDEADFS